MAVLGATNGEGRELQPCCPTLGARLQQLDVSSIEVERERAVQQRPCLGFSESELGGANFR
jgi:hypothetical protein